MRVIMKPLRRTLVFFIFSVFLCGTVSARQIEWQSCMTSPYSDWFGTESSSPELLCGYLSVPLKYTDTGEDVSDENIPLVRLAMTKLPAKSKRKGSIIIISGGPGLPGINPYINFDWPVTNLRESWDIIGFDPRGVGQSFPAINCQQPNQERLVNVSEKQLILQKINACIHNTGAEVIRHIGSHEAVYDIERIRQALGDKQLTAVAYSYGTQIAALYAERFPSSIRSIVFDGVVDIDDLNDKTAVRQFSQGIVSNEIETALNSSIASEKVSDALGVILCVDQSDEQLSQEQRKSRKKALADAFPAVNFEREQSDLPEFCELWPIHRDLQQTRLKNTVLPSGLLFVAHKYDPTTPWINARKMADKFSAPLLTINGDGHTLALAGSNLCVDEAVVRHLLFPGKSEDITCQGSGTGDTN